VASDVVDQIHPARQERNASVERKIACGGSLFVTMDELFGDLGDTLARAGEGGYVVVRDTTCRLFGFHTLLRPDGAFCFDHLFGF
jgi:hypothetical protein